jgi:tetratricopeptide (TPR) repeat protein
MSFEESPPTSRSNAPSEAGAFPQVGLSTPIAYLLVSRLDDSVANFSAGSYNLIRDLVSLENVRQVGAIEATIFYSARILEALSANAVEKIGLVPSSSAFSNLETLIQFDLMPATTQYWANSLRRLGNEVRHILRPTEPQDAELAALYAERWVAWFFCHFRFGPRIVGITRDDQPMLQSAIASLPGLLRAIDAPGFDPHAWLPGQWKKAAAADGVPARANPSGTERSSTEAARAATDTRSATDPHFAADRHFAPEPPFMAAGTVAAVIAEILLDRGETDAAFAILTPAIARFPDDLRLAQLQVLGFKRLGKLDEALQAAGALLARSKDDEETAGIVAGVFKQVYLDRGRDTEMLGKSFRAYRAGWEGSKQSNAYLGINAAATALWQGRPIESRRLAGEVRRLLLDRIAAIARIGDRHILSRSFWDEVTLAEAELLTGELAAARARYQAAFARWPISKGAIKSAADQAGRHLLPLGLTISSDEFFAKSAPMANLKEIVIGITGHRRLVDEEGLRAKVKEAISRLIQDIAHPCRVVILSALAAGADCLVAEVGLNDFAGVLRAAMPLELADYRRDFSESENARFQSLLNRADAIIFPPAGKSPSKPPKASGKSSETQSIDARSTDARSTDVRSTDARLTDARSADAINPAMDRDAAYERVGRYVADHCEILIAIWDGQPARGRGGTAEIVAYARQANKPLVWIKSAPPYDVSIEKC